MTVVMAFTSKDVSRLTGLPQSTLRYWEKTGVFSPVFTGDAPHRPFRRIYDFRDIVSLRTLALLRRTYNVPLQELRRAGEYLRRYSDYPWASLRLGVTGHHLAVFLPDEQRWMSANPLGQMILIEVDQIMRETERDARILLDRDPESVGHVERNRYVLGNSWVVAGTRIPTEAIKHLHDIGLTNSEIIKKYPRLTHEDIHAAIVHEDTLRHQVA